MRIIYPQETIVLAEISELKAAVQAAWNDPVPKAALKAKRAEHAAIRAAHLPAAVDAKTAELAVATGRRRRELEKEIGWLIEEAARLDIPLAEG